MATYLPVQSYVPHLSWLWVHQESHLRVFGSHETDSGELCEGDSFEILLVDKGRGSFPFLIEMGPHCVAEAGLDLDFPASAFQVPGFQLCATILGQIILLLFFSTKDHIQDPELSRQASTT